MGAVVSTIEIYERDCDRVNEKRQSDKEGSRKQNHSKCCQKLHAQYECDKFVCTDFLQDFRCTQEEKCVYDRADDVEGGDLAFGEKAGEVC